MTSAFERISIWSDCYVRKAITDLYQIRTCRNRPCQFFLFLLRRVALTMPDAQGSPNSPPFFAAFTADVTSLPELRLSHDANANAPPAYRGTAVEPHSFGKQIPRLSMFLLQASDIQARWDIEVASNLRLGQTEPAYKLFKVLQSIETTHRYPIITLQ